MIKVSLICLEKGKNNKMKACVISVTKQGDEIAERIKEFLEIDIFSKYKLDNFNIGSISEKCMKYYNAIIFVSSTGIAVRSIAPFIKSKTEDPAVIVIDCTGKYVISLLSGHLGGANELATKIAAAIKAEPIITTASDNMGFMAPDMIAKDNNLLIDDLKNAKTIAALLVDGKRIGIFDEERKIPCPKGYIEIDNIRNDNIDELSGLVYITNKEHIEINNASLGLVLLKLIRKNIILGIGCRKNYDASKMLENVYKTLRQYNIDERAVKIVSTVDIKKDEQAILKLVEKLKSKINIWDIDSIKVAAEKYPGSDFVEKTIGARAVCEPAVELSGGTLLTGKLAMDGMTICIGRCKGECLYL